MFPQIFYFHVNTFSTGHSEGLLQYEVSGCILTFRMFHTHSNHFHHQRNLLHRSRWPLLQPQCLLTPLRMQCLAQLPQTEAQGTNKPWLSTIRSYYMQQSGSDSCELQSSFLHHNVYDLTSPLGHQGFFSRVWSWPLTSTYSHSKECMKLCLHPPPPFLH